jgi:prohibitin 2
MIKRILKVITRLIDRSWLELFGLGALTLLLLLVLWPLIIYTVPAGHAGVMWYRFFGGTVTKPEEVLDEGLHIIFPWDKIFIYDARLQRIDDTVVGLTVDGLSVSLKLAARFSIERNYAGFLHQALGPAYPDTLIHPQMRTTALTFISEQNAEDLYSTRRTTIQSFIENHLRTAFAHISTNVAFDDSYIKLEDVLIEEIHLPEFVRKAIEEKEKVRHMSDAYEFRIEMEQKERQRKRIEAEGIRNFQEIVAPGITDSYLRWQGIQATLKLAQSDNAKVVIIGNGADGLPIILNTDSLQSEKLPSTTLPATKASNDNSEKKQGNSAETSLNQGTAAKEK